MTRYDQPVPSNIIALPAAARTLAYRLTMLDRREIEAWRAAAQRCGFAPIVIHDRAPGDPPELDSYASLHRIGEAWATYGVTRRDGRVETWCCLSGDWLGRYATLEEALLSLLPSPSEAPQLRSAHVIAFQSRLQAAPSTTDSVPASGTAVSLEG